MSSENLLRLLTIFDISEEAEVLINSLRNAGFIVRDVRVEDDEDMLEAGEDYQSILQIPFKMIEMEE